MLHEETRLCMPALPWTVAEDMRDYDSLAHRHSSKDMCVEKPVSLIANLIGFAPAAEDLQYVLGFYAGDSGIDDRLAVRCRIDLAHWPDVVSRLRLKSVHDVSCDPDWQEDFRWLIDAQDAEGQLHAHCHRFINAARRVFQDKVDHRWEIFFSHGSDINAWCAVWRSQEHLNYLSFDQG
ncbi:hypothetical protein O987_26670 [Comamonas testosteroni TK102]|uniref:Uncharacterized protein n=2 Tax=Comamonadaceae TaxID=80864 RepID=A0A076PZV0_COMTE|nr:hypothetical protein O987_26670 [Comamonas testosteroni TK102]MPS87843.1 hypothetical protein [Comamonas sp.]